MSWNGANPTSFSASTKVSKNHVTCARCHFVGETSGMDWTVWSSGERGAARRSVTDLTSSYRSTSVSAVHRLGVMGSLLVWRPSSLGSTTDISEDPEPDVSNC